MMMMFVPYVVILWFTEYSWGGVCTCGY